MPVVGRWAGERVALVGDYDSSGLFEKSREFRNITEELVKVWNSFIELPEMKLTYHAGCSCRDKYYSGSWPLTAPLRSGVHSRCLPLQWTSG